MESSTLWSYDEVQEEMVAAMELWRRSPGEGRSPFAGDGPWHLTRPEVSAQAEWDERVHAHDRAKAGEVEKPRPLPLSTEEVARRDLVSEWIGLAPERDRRLVALVLGWKAKAARIAEASNKTPKPVSWRSIRQQLIRSGEPAASAHGLGMRYSRAVAAITRSLNMAENRALGVSTLLATS